MLKLFKPQFPNPQNKDDTITFPIGFASSTKGDNVWEDVASYLAHVGTKYIFMDYVQAS